MNMVQLGKPVLQGTLVSGNACLAILVLVHHCWLQGFQPQLIIYLSLAASTGQLKKGNISLTSSKSQRVITFSLLFYYLHRSFLLFKFQKFLSKMLLQCHGVQASIKFHFRLNYCCTDIYVKSPHASTIGKRATIPSKRTAQPRALSHFKFYIRN